MEVANYRQALTERLNNGSPPDLDITAKDVKEILDELDHAYRKLDEHYRKLEDLQVSAPETMPPTCSA